MAMSLATPEKIRTLQRKLYRKPKAEPAYRYSVLVAALSRLPSIYEWSGTIRKIKDATRVAMSVDGSAPRRRGSLVEEDSTQRVVD